MVVTPMVAIGTIIITVVTVSILKGNIRNVAKFIYKTVSDIRSIRNVIRVMTTNAFRCI